MRNQQLFADKPYPLSRQQAEQLDALMQTLSPEQKLWVSGYLAGVTAQSWTETAQPMPVAEAAPEMSVTVLYGSETGNAAGLAKQVGSEMEKRGLTATVVDMADYSVRQLKKVKWLIVITATHGEGDPPEPAAIFYEDLHSLKAPKLEGVKFAVLALGDSTYEFYCEAGKAFDRRLEELGGQRFQDRIDCDVDFEEDAETWMESVLDRLSEEAESARSSTDAAGRTGGVVKSFPENVLARVSKPRHDKRNPFPAPVIESVDITGRGSSKQVRHVELSLEGSGLEYTPGDSLGILPQNDPTLVTELIETLGLDPDEPVSLKDESLALNNALTHHYEISVLTPRFVENWSQLSGSSMLKDLLKGDRKAEQRDFLARNHVLDVVKNHPAAGLTGSQLVQGLRRLQPRLYSLASSPLTMAEEAHLTVSLLCYELNGRDRYGVASSHLCNRLALGETLPVYIQENPNFRLPQDGDIPIIMVGAGTGVAPYRAFLWERQERNHRGRNWLLFGERQFRTDFLYQVEWQRFLKDGLLTRMDVAFSRDQAHKIYVQDRLQELGGEIYDWLEEGAYFYVCGDAQQMAPAIHETLQSIVADQGNMSVDNAADYLRNLRRENRYQRDVY